MLFPIKTIVPIYIENSSLINKDSFLFKGDIINLQNIKQYKTIIIKELILVFPP